MLEALTVWGIYELYSWERRRLQGSTARAFRNATQILDWQRALGLAHERQIQRWFLHYQWFIGIWNVWYGSLHFIMPVVALVWLYRADPARYVRWRNTFLWLLPLALLGFWLYPLMPPRLLPHSFGFVDTRQMYFTIGDPVAHWRESPNLYAAMPSLHIGLSTWVALALWPRIRHWWGRALLAVYPAAILFSTVVTGNHYFLDAVGGWLMLALAYAFASAPSWWRATRSEVEPEATSAVRRPTVASVAATPPSLERPRG